MPEGSLREARICKTRCVDPRMGVGAACFFVKPGVSRRDQWERVTVMTAPAAPPNLSALRVTARAGTGNTARVLFVSQDSSRF